MNAFRFRFWAGPTCVKQFANIVRELGAEDVVEGTEHVTGVLDGNDELDVRVKLNNRIAGGGFEIRPLVRR